MATEPRIAAAGDSAPQFRTTLIRVLVVQVLTLLALGYLQVRFGR